MKYTVKEPLNHNGKPYEPGKQVELTDEAAEPLLALGAVVPADAKAAGKGENK